jgi:phosphatidylglycerophosphatase A
LNHPSPARIGPARPVLLLLAQGLGTGRLPLAPGTWGSLLGLGWTALLLLPGSGVLFLAGTALLLALAVPICGRAEQWLERKDPPSVVLDEIASVPLVFVFWLLLESASRGKFPTIGILAEGTGPVVVLGGFVLFRILDAIKPPPIGVCQRLAGGWGVVADDVVAGLITGFAVAAASRWWT